MPANIKAKISNSMKSYYQQNPMSDERKEKIANGQRKAWATIPKKQGEFQEPNGTTMDDILW